MRDQFSSVLNMGPLNQVVGMIPGFNANMIPKGHEKESTDRIKKFLYIMDSMTKEELDCVKPITDTRCQRISIGAGTNPKELLFLLAEHKRFEKMVGRMGKMNLDGLEDMQQVRFQTDFVDEAQSQANDEPAVERARPVHGQADGRHGQLNEHGSAAVRGWWDGGYVGDDVKDDGWRRNARYARGSRSGGWCRWRDGRNGRHDGQDDGWRRRRDENAPWYAEGDDANA